MSETQVTVFDGQNDLQNEVAPIAERAQHITIYDQITRDDAMRLIRTLKGAQKRVEDYWRPIKAGEYESWKRICAREAEMLMPLKQTEKIVKDKVSTFDDALERVRIAEQRRLQAEADARAEAERQRLLKQAEKLKTAELREARIAEAESLSAPTVVLPPAVAKSEGESTVHRWKARLIDITELIRAAANGNPLAIGLLEFNQVAANRQAVASKNHIEVPGVEFYCEQSLAVKAK